MARGKKKETLTPEDRLQAALVPESEQPYPVPGNWRWVYWGVCGDFQAGSAFKNEYQGLTEYKIPFYKVGSLKYSDSNGILYDASNTVNEEVRIKLKAALIPKNSIIFAKIGEAIRLNRRSINPVPCCIDNNLMSFHAKVCLTKYVYFWSLGIDLYNYTNATTVPAIRKSDLEKLDFPLAPSAEQQRIVNRIESLFAKLDEAKQKAQDALGSFETRKAAILHKAFTGELTARWRKEHDVGMESWKEETLESVCYSIFDGDHMPPPKSEQGIPFLVISNVNTGHLSFENTRFVPESYYEALSDTRKPGYGDVLYTLVGSYGIPVIVDSEYPFCFQRHMALLKPKNIDSYYLWYILQSREMFEKATQIATGTAQLTVPIKGLRKLKFNCASANEQIEIVRILDDLLAKEQQAKEAAEGVLEQIDLIKKAILARAFRGELGTNNPSEESAVELLKVIV